MKTITKSFETEVTVTESEEGTFEALVSVTGIKDAQGDIVEPGAFKKTLAEWQVRDRPIPSLWAHQWNNPFSFIGQLTSAEETDRGLHVKGKLDLTNRTGAQVYSLMQRGLVVEFSISGAVRESTIEETDTGWVEHITDIDLWEAGPCFKGANPETELLSIKNAPVALAKALEVIGSAARTETGRAELAAFAPDLEKAATALHDVAGVCKSEDPDQPDPTPDDSDDPEPDPPADDPAVEFQSRLRKARGLIHAAATASASTSA